jgi:hypothetical protein
MDAPDPRPPKRRRARLWIAVAAGIAVTLLLVVRASVVPFKSETLRQQIVATLSDRLDSDVELASVRIRLFPVFHAEASDLTIRQKRQHDVPPLIIVRNLSVDAGFPGLLRKHVGKVTLTGLEINITTDRAPDDQVAGKSGGDSAGQSRDRNADAKDIVLDELVSADARLVIVPRKKDKPPKVWAIHQLTMRSVSFDRPMPFEAALTNAIPPGEIDVKGSFGPWRSKDPGETPLEGTFTFADADLGVFKGIAGILSAHGEFGGSLGRLTVHGETDTPQFTVAVGGHPVPLHTDYHATVDGTNGDTLLDRIDGSFLNTSLVAKGSVVDTPGKQGRTVTLDIVMNKARIEDVLRLAVKASKPPMSGGLKLTTRFVLPPGERDVVEKLRLSGQFAIATAKFTSLDIQKKVDELSKRSRGPKPGDADQPSVVFNFLGQFKLAGGALALQTLKFETPGTRVELAGTYNLRREILNFKGMLSMDATISETQKGWKRLILKPFDPVFGKKGGGGGTAIPIKIEGERSHPAFGLDKRRLLKRGE